MQDNEVVNILELGILLSFSKVCHTSTHAFLCQQLWLQFNNASVNWLQKLADLSPSPIPRLIDGILLTKFDTIDDKVNITLD